MNPTVAKLNAQSDFSDDELVRAVLAGDETAFAGIFERYRKLVVHLVSRFFDSGRKSKTLRNKPLRKFIFRSKTFAAGTKSRFHRGFRV